VTSPASEIIAPDEVVYRKVGKLAPSAAAVLVRETGTAVAWDACACGGYCGYEWLSDAQIHDLAAAGNPRIRATKNTVRHGLYEYRDNSGRALVLAEGGVHWAGKLADRPRH
jgi:hypothetical protein